MKKKLTKVFITGLCILSSSFVLAQGMDAEDNAINPNVRSRPGMNPDNTSVDAQERSREHMDSQNRRLDAQGRTIQDRSAQDRSKDEIELPPKNMST